MSGDARWLPDFRSTTGDPEHPHLRYWPYYRPSLKAVAPDGGFVEDETQGADLIPVPWECLSDLSYPALGLYVHLLSQPTCEPVDPREFTVFRPPETVPIVEAALSELYAKGYLTTESPALRDPASIPRTGDRTVEYPATHRLNSGDHVGPCLYRHFGDDDQLLYVGISEQIHRRMAAHQSASYWADVHHYTVDEFSWPGAMILAETAAILIEKPQRNVALVDPRWRTARWVR